jgi:tetratricopeptide (TPR) repeat protein
MAQPASNPKIEELRFRVKTDPKSRLFYPLAEELRKAGQCTDAEAVLRTGLEAHPTYLSAWVSLGRVLRDLSRDADAIGALNTALQIDPGNVVAARILGDAYLAIGEKVEAIKKYKLVHALMPGDEELENRIAQLDAELRPAPPEPVAEPEPEPTPEPTLESLFGEEHREEIATADVEPMSVAHDESPFEEPVTEYTAAAAAVEAPSGFHFEDAPLAAEVPAPVFESEEADVFAPAPEPPADDLTNTITMADLYAGQGLIDDARHIYENILARHPENNVVRAKLDALNPAPVEPEPAAEAAAAPQIAKIERLQSWLAKMKVGSV